MPSGTNNDNERRDTTMQAMEIKQLKRFALNRIGIAAVAVGTLAVGIVGAVALQDATTGSERVAVAESQAVPRVAQTDSMRFLELNTLLPTRASVSATSVAQMLFLEQNVLPEAPVVWETQSVAEMRFLELNTDLPGTAPYDAHPFDAETPR